VNVAARAIACSSMEIRKPSDRSDRSGDNAKVSGAGRFRLQYFKDLFDHLVGTYQERFRDHDPERPRGLQIDHQLEFGRLLNGQIRSFCAAQQLYDLRTQSISIDLDVTRAVSDKASLLGLFRKLKTCRQTEFRDVLHNDPATAVEYG
jgi:hypothetical protein